MVFESLTLNLNLTSAISKFSEDDFQRDLPLVDVGLRSPTACCIASILRRICLTIARQRVYYTCAHIATYKANL